MAQSQLTHKELRTLWFRVGLGLLFSALIGFALVRTFAPLPTAFAAGISVRVVQFSEGLKKVVSNGNIGIVQTGH